MSKTTETFVTTTDNPYDYFDDFDKWYMYDVAHGYNTCALVDRIAKTSLEESNFDYNKEIERVVDSICRWNLSGNYKKVQKDFEYS